MAAPTSGLGICQPWSFPEPGREAAFLESTHGNPLHLCFCSFFCTHTIFWPNSGLFSSLPLTLMSSSLIPLDTRIPQLWLLMATKESKA